VTLSPPSGKRCAACGTTKPLDAQPTADDEALVGLARARPKRLVAAG
jgi:hypothetical protein